jgi:AmmeMemoRadiSam system protein B
VPFTSNIKENLYKLDDEIILQILKKESKAFYHLAGKSTVCGIFGITVLTEIARIKEWRPKLVKYTTSGDITKQWDNVVGYAGLVFE